MATRARTTFVFGASNVSGIGAEGKSWARNLEHDFYAVNPPRCTGLPFCMASELSPQFYSLGVSGNTAQLLAARALSEMATRLHDPFRRQAQITSVVSIGHVDALVLEESGKMRTSLDDFALHMGNLARQLTHHNRDLLYVGLTACNEEVVHQLRTGERIRYGNTKIKRFEEAACEIVEGYGGSAVPLLDASVADGLPDAFLTSDGIHYTAEGYEWVYRQVKDEFMYMIS